MIAYAAGAEVTYARTLLQKVETAILFPLIALMLGVAVLVFLYGIFEMIQNADNPGERETGRRHMLAGIIGFIIMLSALGLLTIAANTFGITIPT